MPFSGAGTYSAPASSWNPAVDGTDINSTDWTALLADLSTALSLCLTKDGQQTATATVPFAQGITAPTSALGNVYSSTYTPTVTAVTNLTSSSAVACWYTRIGNVVFVAGFVTIEPTLDDTATGLTFSLPVASNFSNAFQGSGVAVATTDTESFGIYSKASNDTMEMAGISRITSSHTLEVQFSYRVI